MIIYYQTDKQNELINTDEFWNAYIDYNNEYKTVCLDGTFNRDQLQRILDLIPES